MKKTSIYLFSLLPALVFTNANAVTQTNFENSVKTRSAIIDEINYSALGGRADSKRRERLKSEWFEFEDFVKNSVENLDEITCTINRGFESDVNRGKFECTSLNSNKSRIHYYVNMYDHEMFLGDMVPLDIYPGDNIKITKNRITKLKASVKNVELENNKKQKNANSPSYYNLLVDVYIDIPTVYILNEKNKKIETVSTVEMALTNKYGDPIKTKSKYDKTRITSKVNSNFNPTPCNGVNTNLIFKVNLLPTGELGNPPQLLKTSGVESCDDAFKRAILMSEPLSLPPEPGTKERLLNIQLQLKGNTVEIIGLDNEYPTTETKYQGTVSEIREAYINELTKAVLAYKKYPKIAQMRGWQGDSVLELKFDSVGKFISKKIIQSSGHDVLDKQALEMVDKSLPFQASPPEALHDENGNVAITLAIPFKLE